MQDPSPQADSAAISTLLPNPTPDPFTTNGCCCCHLSTVSHLLPDTGAGAGAGAGATGTADPLTPSQPPSTFSSPPTANQFPFPSLPPAPALEPPPPANRSNRTLILRPRRTDPSPTTTARRASSPVPNPARAYPRHCPVSRSAKTSHAVAEPAPAAWKCRFRSAACVFGGRFWMKIERRERVGGMLAGFGGDWGLE